MKKWIKKGRKEWVKNVKICTKKKEKKNSEKKKKSNEGKERNRRKIDENIPECRKETNSKKVNYEGNKLEW